MEPYKKLLLANKAWAREKKELKPGFFASLSEGQNPEFLWLGCSDSRVPAEEVTGTQPGELFVHRNIANLVVPSDLNFFSVLQFAVEALKVNHIIVCGHYGCGGISAAISRKDYGLLNKWLYYIKDTYHQNAQELEALSPAQRMNRMVELNVQTQVLNLAKTKLIQACWKNEKRPTIHGWVFGLEDGLIRELIQAGPETHLDSIFWFDSSEKFAK